MLAVGGANRRSVRATPGLPSRAIRNTRCGQMCIRTPKRRYAENEMPAGEADIRPGAALHLPTLVASNGREPFPTYQTALEPM